MERIPDRLLCAPDAHRLEHMSAAAFADSELIRTTSWARPDLWFIDRQGELLCGCVGVVWRRIVADGTPVRVGGVASLVVAPEARGAGLGARLLGRALEEMRAMPAIAAGMLLCDHALVPFYVRLGWRRVTASVRCMQRGGEVDWTGAAMCHTLVASALDSARTVRLNGLPW
ncbi:MAG: family N-acetyltransferase [Rhodospirillales bacterium]|jgi:predicted N-acetyltransferase YhbS|nr:family N-acetyltransferase [Rhodospirillales bacterium]